MNRSRSQNPSLLNLFLTAAVIIVVLGYGIMALNTGDLLWFSSRFNAQPTGIVVHCYGQDLILEPGSGHFQAITTMVNETLSGPKRWDPLTMSDETYQDYLTSPDMVTVELTYPNPVRIHSMYKYFSNVDTLVIPLEGRHAQTNAVFGRNRGMTTAGSLHVDSWEPLLAYLQGQGLCTRPNE